MGDCEISVSLDDGARLPELGTPMSAGIDLFSNEERTIHVGSRSLVGTGVRLGKYDSNDLYGRIAPRSSWACIGIDVGAGVVDSDYRGEIKVLLINNSDRDIIIKKGDKMAQIIFTRIIRPNFVIKELDETQRGSGGFGSTGN